MDEEQDNEPKKIGFKDLSTSLKIVVVYIWVNLTITIAILSIGLIGILLMLLE